MKPAFWSDATVAELSERTRLFYIGLWMIADDAGWLRWNASEVARDLYGYEPRTRRERRSQEMFDELVRARRVMLHPCGHAEVPKLASHQHLAASAKQVKTIANEHLKDCVARPADTRGTPPTLAETRLVNGNGQDVEGKGTGRNGKSTGRAGEPRPVEEETEFQKLVPRDIALGKSA